MLPPLCVQKSSSVKRATRPDGRTTSPLSLILRWWVLWRLAWFNSHPRSSRTERSAETRPEVLVFRLISPLPGRSVVETFARDFPPETSLRGSLAFFCHRVTIERTIEPSIFLGENDDSIFRSRSGLVFCLRDSSRDIYVEVQIVSLVLGLSLLLYWQSF